ncbi:hypothetical protein DBB36_04550 [Flavobacterium sp. WLB]|uniref:hypothetical protein n=1 Tax=unclassified Flavobacterium TaxID=196869 RepID=UPI0006ABD3A7|nr:MULTISPECIES: hypothetical protein [unclassified Flavobacterium]KOP37980.1 hypothetical protein AKO67_11785 [Flavobacterium sp. VMW]OWU90649.1 hypothetical protein APR43_11755 [Flavobacterium sp. NLM]PUU71236.1 hypothetical protein DBB36_04550 [Flavobacterium sp. WLB]
MKFLKLIGDIFFVFCTVVLTTAFYTTLKKKIEKPNFKNLDTTGFIFFGIIVLSLIFISFKIVSAYFKKSKI